MVKSPKNLTLAKAWAEAWKIRFRHLVSARNEESRWRTHLAGRWGQRPLYKISVLDIDRLKGELLSRSLKPATVTQILGLIGRLYNLMTAWGLYHGPNPLRQIKMPQADNRRRRFLAATEAHRLLAELQGRSPRSYRLALLSLATGMRAGEVLGLRGEHVRLDDGTISVMDTKSRRDRVVDAPPAAQEILREMNLSPGRRLFSGRRVGGVFFSAVERQGLNTGRQDPRDRVVFHTLRHTFASWLVQRGVSLYIVANLLGHANLSMTQRYAHLSPEILRGAVEVWSEAFWDSA